MLTFYLLMFLLGSMSCCISWKSLWYLLGSRSQVPFSLQWNSCEEKRMRRIFLYLSTLIRDSWESAGRVIQNWKGDENKSHLAWAFFLNLLGNCGVCGVRATPN